jgi:hypothetical protein
VKQPIEAVKATRAITNDPNGSARSAESAREVNTQAVSRVVSPPIFLAKMEKLVKVGIEAKTWVTQATVLR